MTYGLSVTVPRVDNSAAIDVLVQRIDRMDRIAERAREFAALPFARQDAVVQMRIQNLLIDCSETIWYANEEKSELVSEHGSDMPTEAIWNALTDQERQDMTERYIEVDCRNGAWEFNRWGPFIERDSAVFNRH